MIISGNLLKVQRRHFGISVVASLPFHNRWDSEKRTQLSGNLEDILKAFEVLDGICSIPSIFVEHLIFLGCHQSLLIL